MIKTNRGRNKVGKREGEMGREE